MINFCLFLILCVFATTVQATPDPHFIDISSINKNIKVELRYASDWNFVGHPIKGYQDNRCYLSKPAAEALSNVQKYLEPKGLSVLVFDCYRPQRAVNEFMNWSKNFKDQKMKKIFYPDEAKEQLFEKGYIAERSGHSRGSTIDLTLIKFPLSKKSFHEEAIDCRKHKNIEATGQLDMGTSYDCFDSMANTDSPKTTAVAKKNRLLLKETMERHGFKYYPLEWWHFTLKDEPYKEEYFDWVPGKN